MKKIFRNKYGQTYLILELDIHLGLVYSQFIGIQTMETAQEGLNQVLKLLAAHQCTKYLNNSGQLVGGWEFANDWVQDVWLPTAVRIGLRHLAHIMAPEAKGIRTSMEELDFVAPPELEIMFFDNAADARQWLTSVD